MGKYYVVTRGRQTGVFWPTAHTCRSRVARLVEGIKDDAIWEGYDSQLQAEAVFDAACAKGYVQEIGNGGPLPPYPPQAARDAARDLHPLDGPWGHNVQSNWYFVRHGRAPGVYPTWIDAAPQVKGLQECRFDGFEKVEGGYNEAVNRYEQAVARGVIVRVREPPIYEPQQHFANNRVGDRVDRVSTVPLRKADSEPSILFPQPASSPVRLHESMGNLSLGKQGPSTERNFYMTPASVKRENVHSSPQVSYHRSLPVMQPASPVAQSSFTRSHSERIEPRRLSEVEPPTEYSFSPSMYRQSSTTAASPRSPTQVTLGNPGFLKPWAAKPSQKPAPLPNDVLSPIHHSELSLSNIEDPLSIGLTSRPSDRNEDTFNIHSPMSSSSLSSRVSVDIPVRSPSSSRGSKSDHPVSSPRHPNRVYVASSKPSTPRFTEQQHRTPTKSSISGSSVTMSLSSSPQPFEQRSPSSATWKTREYGAKSPKEEGAFNIGFLTSRPSPRAANRSTPHSTPRHLTQSLGLSQMQAPHTVRGAPSVDARSPIPSGTTLPLPYNSLSFGRPSPATYPVAVAE
ncbi:hypothetical protein FA15DRAFT_672004 [Coprinopsis marcescibilis]|uniref:Ribonuclease H1 N-terminal domain-containing protein n=1 Tax=Coprinopsis marcescibilis TaxID=230819 RepID=A0A5C3KNN3_COPMA|nr:hypothetical protein FA15DRAFT_672004 [Coprinopsis marcescibilis]